MNTQFISKSAKQHGSKVVWTGVISALLALAASVIQQHQTSSDNHAAAWVKLNSLEQRIEVLEMKQAYQAGFDAGLTESKKVGKTAQ